MLAYGEVRTVSRFQWWPRRLPRVNKKQCHRLLRWFRRVIVLQRFVARRTWFGRRARWIDTGWLDK